MRKAGSVRGPVVYGAPHEVKNITKTSVMSKRTVDKLQKLIDKDEPRIFEVS